MSVLTPEEKKQRIELRQLRRRRDVFARKARQQTAKLSKTLRQYAAIEEIIADIERAKAEGKFGK